MSIARFINRKSIANITPLLILLVLSCFAVFNNLGKSQIKMWDEATYANNSLDMLLSSNNILVVEHLGKPDLYNTKPPFVIWMQALSMKVFGINEFAIRFPSALFGLLCVLSVYFFCVRILKSKLIGFISAMILVTTKGYVGYHVVRTGDLDAVLVFWLTLGLFTFIDLVITKPKNSFYHFLILSISCIGGFMTKGIAGFFFVPFMLIIMFLYNNHQLFKQKSLYIAAFVTLLFCSAYYFIRELLAPGYIQVVVESEILRYTHKVMTWHVHPFNFYFQNLKSQFHPFFYILPIVLLNPFILKDNKLKTSIYLTIVAVGYFLLISYPTIKLEWYIAPLFPLLSILIGLSFVEIGIFIFKKLNIRWNPFLIKSLLLGIALIFLFKPYKTIIDSIKHSTNYIFSMELDGAYLKYLKENRPDIKTLTVFKQENHEEDYDQVLFYKRAYELQYNYHIRITQEMDFKKDEIVMVCKEADKERIQKDYIVEEINNWRDGTLFLIKDKAL